MIRPGDTVKVQGVRRTRFVVKKIEGIAVHCLEIEGENAGKPILGRFRTFHRDTVEKA